MFVLAAKASSCFLADSLYSRVCFMTVIMLEEIVGSFVIDQCLIKPSSSSYEFVPSLS